MEENRGAILRAEVWPLAIDLGGIVNLPEGVEQLVVADFGRVEGDLHNFGVAGFVGAHVFVSWIGSVAAGIAYGGVDHAGDFLEGSFDAPEASGPESG